MRASRRTATSRDVPVAILRPSRASGRPRERARPPSTKVKNKILRMSRIGEQTFVRSGRPRRWATQDEVREFDFDRAIRLVSWNRSASLRYRTSRTEDAVRQRIVTLSIIALMCAAARTDLAPSADIVAINGKVFTARAGAELAQGFAVKGQKFIAVGSTEAMRAHVRANSKGIDLVGRFFTPGLADGHFHNQRGGPGIDLPPTHSLADPLPPRTPPT